MKKHDGVVAEAQQRLERWLVGHPDFLLQTDVCLVLDALREAQDLSFEMMQLEVKYARLRADVDDLDQRIRSAS